MKFSSKKKKKGVAAIAVFPVLVRQLTKHDGTVKKYLKGKAARAANGAVDY